MNSTDKSDRQKDAEIALSVNGSEIRIDPARHSNLLALIRTDLRLTGTKTGCATGNCGACTVLVDGTAMQSCQISLGAAENSNVETIESIIQTRLGNKIISALKQYDAAQCGYCLPGIVLSAYAELLTTDSPNPIHALQNNMCRCGTHSRILSALNEVMATQNSKYGGTIK